METNIGAVAHSMRSIIAGFIVVTVLCTLLLMAAIFVERFVDLW